jgi:hypothetical protein
MTRSWSRAVVLACVCALSGSGSQAARAAAGGPTWVSQGWSDEDREAFWFTPQGSMLVPYAWFLNLEQSNNTTAFRDDAHMDALRYLPVPASKRNPDALPIGFVRDRLRPDMLGLTCAACHTNRLEHAGAVVQVEGGPAHGDFQKFLAELVEALQATAGDDAKFQRFAAKVAGEASGPKADALRAQVRDTATRLAAREKLNAAPYPYGHGRVDALGNILNEVLSADLGVPKNARPADAPVSYPVLWDVHQHDFVQWNGSAPNLGTGPVLRNIGEVLGVFGDMSFSPRAKHLPVYHGSSVDVDNLRAIEDWLKTLQSPPWPSAFPAVDPKQASAGQAIYAQHCQGCHAAIKRDDPNRKITAHMVAASSVGTDPVAAENFLSRTADTGPLQGSPVFVKVTTSFGPTAGAADILRNAVTGVHLANAKVTDFFVPPTELKAFADGLLARQPPPQLTKPMYKARPLNGVWASAPYLHNGSVPDLWSMLQPFASRPQKFYTGSRQFDPVKVGFKSDAAEEGGVKLFELDTSLRGNSNSGHPYGTNLTDEQKRQLIEYLKTL